ncbi:hypothetical protein [Streptomyces sp. NRRL F-2664]|uniref:hypothetical protein n=1 Tax=Streptomyces sp. NRRL F-2664 TaxID=1463842 RepID=UPI00068B0FAF|nr:hypothetical protein [Streptomyces sp. NRRL F-2664]
MKSGASDEQQAPLYPGEATPSERTEGLRVDEPAGTTTEDGPTSDEPMANESMADRSMADESAADRSMADESAADESTDRVDSPAQAGGDAEEPLLGTADTDEYRRRWSEIQGRFVDDPQDAVRSADTLVAEVMQALAGSFSTRKQGLEGQWGRGEEVATEDLRVSLQQYRSFFNRLLKT